MKSEIEKFLILFSRLLKETNRSVEILRWLPTEKASLYGLCYDLNTCFGEISRLLVKKKMKHTIAPPIFFSKWEEYKRNWEPAVAEAAKIEEERILEALEHYKESLDGEKPFEEVWKDLIQIFPGLIDAELYPEEHLDPLIDDPAAIVEDLYGYIDHFVMNDYFDGVINDKHIEAWDFFKDTIGINYSAIYDRWKSTPELFIPIHTVSRNITPIEDLYNESVRAYIFGLTEASVAMCRALMEHILRKYYHISGDNLGDIISQAERKYQYLKGLKLHSKRELANKVLHDYENRGKEIEKAALDFLQTIRHLVNSIPSP